MEKMLNEASVVGKTIFSDGKGKLFFGYYKTDDAVEFVDYKTWKKLSFKDVSKGDTNKERVIKAIVKNQKQFNKKVDFNMWAKKQKRSFEDTMDWFIQNGWINNINKGGIKESVDVLSVNEGISVSDERHFGKKGIIIMIDDNGKKVSAIFKDKKNADKFNRNNPSDIKKLLDLAKKTKYPKAIDESVNEGKSFVVMFKVKKDINNRNVKPSTAVYSSEADAKKFLQSVEKDGGNGMITRSNVKGMKEAKFGYKDSTSSYINKHKDEYKVAEKLNKGNEVKFYDSLSQMEEKIGHPKFMIFLSNALRGYKVDMYKDPKIKNPQDAQEALYLLSK
jgi:hypothetical protein